MTRKRFSSAGNYSRQQFSGAGLRAGVARDKLIFIIICSAALVVALVSLVQFWVGGPEGISSQWQCLNCDHKLDVKEMAISPIECPKCGGEAVRLGSALCQQCKKEILYRRVCDSKPPEGAASRGTVRSTLGPSASGYLA